MGRAIGLIVLAATVVLSLGGAAGYVLSLH